MGEEVLLDVSFATARARLTELARSGSLLALSQHAYGRLAEVQIRDVLTRAASARFALRWEATGPGNALLPVLDADITLTPSGEGGTLLVLAGVYRPPLEAPGAGLEGADARQPPPATIRQFVIRMAGAISTRAG